MRLQPRQRVVALAGVQLGDAAFNVAATGWVRDDLERLKVPWTLRPVFPIVKTASAIGLLGGLKWPRLGRLTANLLIVYFLLALGAHARASDRAARYAPAAAMLGYVLVTREAFTPSGRSTGTGRRWRRRPGGRPDGRARPAPGGG